MIADGFQRASHRRELLVCIDDGLGEIQIFRVAEDVVDLLHEDIGRIEDDHHDGAHTEYEKNRPHERGDDLPHRLLLFAADVKHLARHRGDAEAKHHGNTDQGHAPVDV